jgi:hypothetical protein
MGDYCKPMACRFQDDYLYFRRNWSLEVERRCYSCLRGVDGSPKYRLGDMARAASERPPGRWPAKLRLRGGWRRVFTTLPDKLRSDLISTNEMDRGPHERAVVRPSPR